MDRDFGKDDETIGTLSLPLQQIGLKLRRAKRYGKKTVGLKVGGIFVLLINVTFLHNFHYRLREGSL